MSNLRVNSVSSLHGGPVDFVDGISGKALNIIFPPRILAFDPEALTEGVSTSFSPGSGSGPRITVTFDQTIEFAEGEGGVVGIITITKDSASGTVLTQIDCDTDPGVAATCNGTQLIIQPQVSFPQDTAIFVTLPSVGIANTFGDFYEGSQTYQFKTELTGFQIFGGDDTWLSNDPTSPTSYYRYHIFQNSGPLQMNGPSASATDLTAMIVAGGGGGSYGGGGAGGVIVATGPQLVMTTGEYTISVGSGGAGSPTNAIDGNDTTITPISSPTGFIQRAYGGGRGAGTYPEQNNPVPTTYYANPGGSGGGVRNNTDAPATNNGIGIPGQGNPGGSGTSPEPTWGEEAGAGGGGAGGSGGSTSNTNAGPGARATLNLGSGGSGRQVSEFSYSNIAPSPIVPADLAPEPAYFAGGGAGGNGPRQYSPAPMSGGTGGTGGGGNGQWPNSNYPSPPGGFTDGKEMTGGGGGGGSGGDDWPTVSPVTVGNGNGGDGVVMVRYAYPSP